MRLPGRSPNMDVSGINPPWMSQRRGAPTDWNSSHTSCETCSTPRFCRSRFSEPGTWESAAARAPCLHRSLLGLRALIGRSLAEVRLTQGIQNQDTIRLFELIDEVVAAAVLHAQTIGLRLTVLPVDQDIAIQGDRQVLAAVVGNLLQNAFKFTRPQTTVTLRVRASAERVLIEVEDECGGLPGANHDDLFRPFEQRSRDRTGLGLGLAFSRWGVEANHGRIYARNLPERGCVFTVDLPRLAEPDLAMN